MQKYEKFNNAYQREEYPRDVSQSDQVHIDMMNQNNSRNTADRRESAGDATVTISSAGLTIPDPASHGPYWADILQHRVKRVVEHLAFRIFGLVLIIVDISVLIADLCIVDKTSKEELAYEIVALCFVSYFVLEILLRIYAKGPSHFFRTWFNVIDCVVVVIALFVTIIYTVKDISSGYAKLVVAGRLVRIVIFIRFCTEKKNLEKGARQIVSQNKRRYQKDGFDLDLTYVTERIIAMSFPSSGKMSLYRNPIREVARFFDTKHPNHFKIYNLCSEKSYDENYFHGRVERIMIDDHNVPLLKDMIRFVKSVHEWLSQDDTNIIAVHCKGGKGRTGTLICVWLVEAGLFDSAAESLDYFGTRRTDLSVGSKFQGVETPSQSRFVGYFETIKEKYNGQIPPDVPLKLKLIKIHSMAGVGNGNGSDFTCEIDEDKVKVFQMGFGNQFNCQADYYSEKDVLEVKPLNCPVLSGNIRVKFISESPKVPRNYEDCPFYFWFHTSFVENNSLHLPREQLDNPHKEKTWKIFRSKFAIELIFESL